VLVFLNLVLDESVFGLHQMTFELYESQLSFSLSQIRLHTLIVSYFYRVYADDIFLFLKFLRLIFGAVIGLEKQFVWSLKF